MPFVWNKNFNLHCKTKSVIIRMCSYLLNSAAHFQKSFYSYPMPGVASWKERKQKESKRKNCSHPSVLVDNTKRGGKIDLDCTWLDLADQEEMKPTWFHFESTPGKRDNYIFHESIFKSCFSSKPDWNYVSLILRKGGEKKSLCLS